MGIGSEIIVRHNPKARRYEAEVDGRLAVAEYTRAGERIVFTHTFVPPELRRRGIAGQLVRNALEDVRLQRRRVVPACRYVAAFIRRNPEFQGLVDAPARQRAARGASARRARSGRFRRSRRRSSRTCRGSGRG